jgi:DNA processing protein
MSVMNHVEERYLRLGLVLAGARSRVRRLIAEESGRGFSTDLLSDCGVPTALLETATKLARAEARTTVERIETAGWQWLIPGDSQYPELLAATADPPLGLFVRGRIEERPTVAIVGSRKATPYGLQVARLLGEELGKAGVVMVSGMARGVDEAAHRGALAAGGPSWAVWGAGPDRIYPPEHGKLAEKLAATGALITEYPPGTPPRRHHFPERNRILSGIARAVVVIEAAARSGALITARLAMEEGREVLAVPGNIFSELSVGPNTLLRVGARPLLTPRDLFEAIGCEPRCETEPSPDEGLLCFIKAGEAVTADEIAARAEITVSEVLGNLLALELAGEVSRGADGKFSRLRISRATISRDGV